ncbi:hypothetical protein QE438_002791 [Pseudoxanthomonas sp. SORGH_AS 997]|nr:hypothetical protein [Pseudoxanthomonas sp. SORGH_AS_0997]
MESPSGAASDPQKVPIAPGQRQLLGDQARHRLRGEIAAGRAAVDADVLRAVVAQQRAVDGFHILAGGGEGVLRSLAVIHRDHLDFAHAGDRDGLGQRAAARAPQEGAAVQVDQHTRLVGWHDAVGRLGHVGQHAVEALLAGAYRPQLAHARHAVAVLRVVERPRRGDVLARALAAGVRIEHGLEAHARLGRGEGRQRHLHAVERHARIGRLGGAHRPHRGEQREQGPTRKDGGSQRGAPADGRNSLLSRQAA